MRRIRIIAAFTALEAVRNRLLWAWALAAALALALSAFGASLALAEARQVQAALAGSLLRLASALLVAGFVVTSMRREADERVQEMLLAQPLPRGHYVMGKLAGFCAVATVAAALCTLALLPVVPALQAALWGASLALELAITAAFALFCATGLRHAVPALAATLGFYLLARTIGGLQALGHGPSASSWQGALVDALAMLVPHLDAFAPSEWLVYHNASAGDLARAAAQAAISLAVLGSAATLDLQRRELE